MLHLLFAANTKASDAALPGDTRREILRTWERGMKAAPITAAFAALTCWNCFCLYLLLHVFVLLYLLFRYLSLFLSEISIREKPVIFKNLLSLPSCTQIKTFFKRFPCFPAQCRKNIPNCPNQSLSWLYGDFILCSNC